MKKLLIVLLSGVLFVNCNSKPASVEPEKSNTYSKEGLSFDLPEYWKIAEDSQITGGRYIEIENDEPLSSGLVVISIFDSIQNNAAVVEMMNNKYRRIFSEQKLQYEIMHEPKDVTIGKIKAKEGNGQIQALGEKEKIRVLVFDLSGKKTFCLALTGSSNDYNENVKESEQIVTSMKLE